MIANLPLLFVNGYPTTLRDISAEELEKFITFMVTCSWGHDTVRNIREPPWWPADVVFSHPFVRPQQVPEDWQARLKNLVKKCYDYHQSAILLAYTAKLAKYPRNSLRFVDNRDHTTSLFSRLNGRLLVTFRNENISYDKPPLNNVYEGTVQSTNIYLCENCDSHFDNLDRFRAHERLCNSEESPVGSSSGGLHDLLSALKLQPVNSSAEGPKPNSINGDVKLKNGRTAANIDRGPPYPFSSLAYMRNAKCLQRDTSYSRERIERYCTSTPISKNVVSKGRTLHFPVRYRRPIDYWHRTHTFPNQRKKKILSLEGQLLLLKCKPVSVNVDRMSIESMRKYIDDMKKLSEQKTQQIDKDIVFVDNLDCDQPVEMDMKISDPLKKIDNDCEVIDLCSDDESPSVNENCDPRLGVTCVMRGGAILRRTADTPQSLPAEPCGARQRPIAAAVLQPHPVILIAHTFNTLQTISLD